MEEGLDGLNSLKIENNNISDETLINELTIPGPKRLFYVADAIRQGWSLEKIYSLTKIDFWFLDQLNELINIENDLISKNFSDIDSGFIRELKKKGFSDKRIGKLLRSSEDEIRSFRLKNKIKPVFRRVDTCAAEFATSTCYMYSTYDDECESNPSLNKKILVLGSGPNRIGQGLSLIHISEPTRR